MPDVGQHPFPSRLRNFSIFKKFFPISLLIRREKCLTRMKMHHFLRSLFPIIVRSNLDPFSDVHKMLLLPLLPLGVLIRGWGGISLRRWAEFYFLFHIFCSPYVIFIQCTFLPIPLDKGSTWKKIQVRPLSGGEPSNQMEEQDFCSLPHPPVVYDFFFLDFLFLYTGEKEPAGKLCQ